MDGDQTIKLMEELKREQQQEWMAGLRVYMEWKGCQLGFCDEMKELHHAVNAATSAKEREEAKMRLQSEMDLRQAAWLDYVGKVERLEVAITTLRQRLTGRL